MTREEFLVWAEQQPAGRYERIDGMVVAMAPERAPAARVARRRGAATGDATMVSASGISAQGAFISSAAKRKG